MNTTHVTYCIVSFAQASVIDVIDADTDRTCVWGESLAEVQQRIPDAQRMEWNAACALLRRAYVSEGAKRITRERFEEMLNILPPVRHRQSSDFESFELPEQIADRVVSYFVRLGQDYWTFDDVMLMDTDSIAKRVHVSAAEGQPA